MKMRACYLEILVVAWSIATVQAAKILMMPGNANSHTLMFANLGKELSEVGNKVHFLMPSNNKMADLITVSDNFTIIRYQVDVETPFASSREFSETVVEVALASSTWTKMRLWSQMEVRYNLFYAKECESLMENKALIWNLKNGGFQFVIIDPWTVPGCNFLIPKILGIPYGVFAFPVTWNTDIARVPRLPSFFPFVGMDVTDEISFFHRLLTLLLTSVTHLKYARSESEQYFTQKYFDPDSKSSYHEILANASIWLFLEDISLNLPLPNMPNTVSVGDFRRPAKLLSEDLESFLHETQEMAILVSFGSLFDYVPEYLARSFCNVFRQLKHQVIWKLKNATYCENVKNVKVMDWIPQNDILAHPKIRLFITHGGFNSLSETVYHGKPVIIFPVAFEQPNNAAVVVKKGYGIRMYFSDFIPEDLIENIDKIFRDPSYTDNAQKASAIMKDKRDRLGDRASFLINHVIKHGDSHLKTGAHKLSLFQFYMFDIFLFISVSVLLFCATITMCICWLCKRASRYLTSPSKQKTS